MKRNFAKTDRTEREWRNGTPTCVRGMFHSKLLYQFWIFRNWNGSAYMTLLSTRIQPFTPTHPVRAAFSSRRTALDINSPLTHFSQRVFDERLFSVQANDAPASNFNIYSDNVTIAILCTRNSRQNKCRSCDTTAQFHTNRRMGRKEGAGALPSQVTHFTSISGRFMTEANVTFHIIITSNVVLSSCPIFRTRNMLKSLCAISVEKFAFVRALVKLSSQMDSISLRSRAPPHSSLSRPCIYKITKLEKLFPFPNARVRAPRLRMQMWIEDGNAILYHNTPSRDYLFVFVFLHPRFLRHSHGTEIEMKVASLCNMWSCILILTRCRAELWVVHMHRRVKS